MLLSRDTIRLHALLVGFLFVYHDCHIIGKTLFLAPQVGCSLAIESGINGTALHALESREHLWCCHNGTYDKQDIEHASTREENIRCKV
jgi:hypothetical protein